ncbi:MAG: hypothetical protein IPM35_35375 [Myxococcales bacterium]|nr:hypothetical protein [Myxococcales bacterium]
MELAAGELVEHLGELLDQAGHAHALGRAVLGVAETLGAVGEERGARVVQVEPAAVELCQVEDDVGARRPLRAHGGREPLAELVIGDRRESIHAFWHITRFFELAADTLSAFRASERVARRRAREHMPARHDARARGHRRRGRRTRTRVARNCVKRNRRIDALSLGSPYAEMVLARPPATAVHWSILKWATLLFAVATRVERLEHAARTEPGRAADTELTSSEIEALVLLKRRERKRTESIPDVPPDIFTAVRWLADLGGYTGSSSGGPPGLTVIWRGFERVRTAADALEELGVVQR